MIEDMILGMSFLMNNDVEIYCRSGLLKIEDIYLRFHEETLKFKGPDEMLTEKFDKIQEKRFREV